MDALKTYYDKHRHPMNRLTHFIGIPMIVLSIPLFFFIWKVALALFVVGWALQFIGHLVEGNSPAFFSNPKYLFVGVYWWVKKVLRLV